MFAKLSFVALALATMTAVNCEANGPTPIEPMQLILYPGTRCQESGEALFGTPGLPVPLGECVSLPVPFEMINLRTNQTSTMQNLDMVCAVPRKYTFGMTDCSEQVATTQTNFDQYCMRIPLITDEISFRIRCWQGPPACKPSFETDRKRCQTRIRGCNANGVKLKWAGPGCRRNGKLVGDGGCQCDGYCGYGCRNACNRDSQCFWNNTASTCFMKGRISPVPEFSTEPAPGGPIPFCSAQAFINVPAFLNNALPSPVFVGA